MTSPFGLPIITISPDGPKQPLPGPQQPDPSEPPEKDPPSREPERRDPPTRPPEPGNPPPDPIIDPRHPERPPEIIGDAA